MLICLEALPRTTLESSFIRGRDDREEQKGHRERKNETERENFGSSLSPLWEPGCHPGDLVGGLRPTAAKLGFSEALQGRFAKVPP